MDAALRSGVESALASAEGTAVAIVGSRSVGGGCIHQAELLEVLDLKKAYRYKRSEAHIKTPFRIKS